MIVRQEVDMSDVSLSVYMSNLHCEKFNYDYSENETISDVWIDSFFYVSVLSFYTYIGFSTFH